MRYRVLVPAEPSGAIPRGAAVLEYRRGARGAPYGRVYAGRDQFGELCAHAARHGRLVALPDGCTEVGYYDTIDGELRAHRPGLSVLERWLGRRVYHGDFEARDNRSARRAEARRLLFQGRIAEAAKLDPTWAYSPGHHDLRQLRCVLSRRLGRARIRRRGPRKPEPGRGMQVQHRGVAPSRPARDDRHREGAPAARHPLDRLRVRGPTASRPSRPTPSRGKHADPATT
jgi:hypothetical protein